VFLNKGLAASFGTTECSIAFTPCYAQAFAASAAGRHLAYRHFQTAISFTPHQRGDCTLRSHHTQNSTHFSPLLRANCFAIRPQPTFPPQRYDTRGADTIIILHFFVLVKLTTHITGSKKQSDEGATLFAVRVHVIVMQTCFIIL